MVAHTCRRRFRPGCPWESCREAAAAADAAPRGRIGDLPVRDILRRRQPLTPAVRPVPPGSNVVDVVVDGGPNGNSVNSLFTTVTICVPGSTTQCQTIDNILVDTGSYGLRLLVQVLTLSLPVAALPSSDALLECTVFVDGYSWGPVAAMDVTITGEMASSVPVQLIGDARFPTVPADCSSAGREYAGRYGGGVRRQRRFGHRSLCAGLPRLRGQRHPGLLLFLHPGDLREHRGATDEPGAKSRAFVRHRQQRHDHHAAHRRFRAGRRA